MALAPDGTELSLDGRWLAVLKPGDVDFTPCPPEWRAERWLTTDKSRAFAVEGSEYWKLRKVWWPWLAATIDAVDFTAWPPDHSLLPTIAKWRETRGLLPRLPVSAF